MKPEMVHKVQDLITELVNDGWRIVYTGGSSKKINKQRKTERADLGCLCQMTSKDPKPGSQGVSEPSTGFTGTTNEQCIRIVGSAGGTRGILGPQASHPDGLTVPTTRGRW